MKSLSSLMSMVNKSVIITGATGHLGQVIAETLAELGANLILVDRENSNFEQVESKILSNWDVKIISISCDLENEKDRKKLIDRIKFDGLNVDCLINNAAFVGSSNLHGWAVPFETQSLETWRRAFEVNLTAVFELSQALAKVLSLSKNGNIINISSIYGFLAPDWSLYHGTSMANPAAYSASKGALIQLSKWLATTLAPHIRVNVISPGGIYRNQPEIFVKRYLNKTPLNRMAVEEDFKGAIAYLASDMSKYVTGHNLVVDGGFGSW